VTAAINKSHESELMVWLVPNNSRSAQLAGRDFARALLGAPSAAFMMALGEQSELIRVGIQRHGWSKRKARDAAGAFVAGARTEWRRLASAGPAMGSA
jgi:hypothetical protein